MPVFGDSIKIEGESEYRRALQQIVLNLKEVSAEMKIVSATYDKNDKSTDAVAAKTAVLTQKLDEQNKKVELLTKVYNDLDKEYGENSQKQAELNKQLDDAKTKLAEVAKTAGESSKEYQEQQKVVENLESSQYKYNKALSDAKVDMLNAEAASAKTTKELDKLAKSSEQGEKDMTALAKATKNSGDEAEKASSGYTVMKNVLANLASDAIKSGIQAIGTAIKNVARGFNEWSQLARDVQEQEAKVVQVMQNTTDASNEEIQALINLTAQKEKTGVVSQQTQLAGLQELGTYVSQKESLEALLPVMNDMVAQQYGVGASMQSATNIATMMGKVLGNGQVDALKRLGYAFDDNQKQILQYGAEEEKVRVLTEVVTASVGGMNEALAKTDAGSAQIAASYLNDLKVTAGNAFSSIKNELVSGFTPAVREATEAIKGMIAGNVDVEEGMTQIFNGISESLDNLNKILPDLLETGGKILTALLQGIADHLPEIMPTIIMIMDKVINIIVDNLPLILDCGIKILLALIEGLIQALPQLIEKIPEIIIGIATAILENLPKIFEMGWELIIALIKGILKAIPKLIEALPKLWDAMWNYLKSLPEKWVEIGGNLIKGLWEGIKNMGKWVIDKIKGFGKSILKAVKSIFGINSPSKVMEDEVGKNIALGLIKGIDDEESNVKKSAEDLASVYISSAKTKIKALESANEITTAQEVDFWNTILETTKSGTKEYDEAYTQLNNAKNKLAEESAKQAEEIKKSTESLTSDTEKLTKEFAQNITKIEEDTNKEIDKLWEDYENSLNKRYESILNSFNLFDEVKTDDAIAKSELLQNLKDQVTTLKEWDQVLDNLRERIQNEDLLEYLEQQGVKAIEQLKAINGFSDDELAQYEALYERKQKIALNRAKDEHKMLKETTKEQVADLKAQATQQIDELKTAYVQNLQKLAGETKTEGVNIGEAISAGISDGLINGLDNTEDKIRNRVKKITQAIEKDLDINSPSRVYRDEIGKQMAAGIGLGFEQEMQTVTSDIKNAVPRNFDVKNTQLSYQLEKQGNFIAMVDAFKTALSQMSVELDDVKLGKFVTKTVSRAIYV